MISTCNKNITLQSNENKSLVMGRIEKANPATLNPCHKESDLTYKCLDDNNYDRDKCLKAMENYQLCKSFWGFVRTQRRREGKYPLLPPEEERDEIKKYYIDAFLSAKR
ncbi:coiled-coil-helix-coiled-coil-helix domain-containing protein 7 [Atheta coriaria]|uniref:coiled-coil-helix-coiled-coil-helix domain-containing protein 7 n=1 Tax=Dalotia coriaria TaxID=877792 RepID=UPI0031F3CC6E